MRYNYPLNVDSWVLDVGAYDGAFSKSIYEKYQCNIYAFEPIIEYYEVAKTILAPYPKVRVRNTGLGANHRSETFNVAGHCSGMFPYLVQPPIRYERVSIVPIDGYISDPLDLLKLNVEGMEYEILEHLVGNGMIKKIKNILVQFHEYKIGIRPQYEALRAKLLKTHELTFDEEWIWANYQLK